MGNFVHPLHFLRPVYALLIRSEWTTPFFIFPKFPPAEEHYMTKSIIDQNMQEISGGVPELSVSESLIKSSVDASQPIVHASFKITNSGTGKLIFKISSAASWVVSNCQEGQLGKGECRRVMLTCHPPFCNNGRYESVITIASNGGYHLIRVVMLVTAEDRASFFASLNGNSLHYHGFILP